MYAIVEAGGKQHKVQQGDVVKIEKVELGVGETLTLDKVLMAGDDKGVKCGAPYLEGASVKAEVIEQSRDKKVTIIKFRRRKNSMTRQGHRQYYTAIKITKIEA